METVSLKDSRTKGEKSLRLVFASGSDGGCQLQVLNLMGGTKGTAESSTSSTTPQDKHELGQTTLGASGAAGLGINPLDTGEFEWPARPDS